MAKDAFAVDGDATREDLSACLQDARARSLALVEDLDTEQWYGPELEIVNPPIWELGHVAWFQERWCLRHPRGTDSLREDADALYDSIAILHRRRWRLDFPDRNETLQYARTVLDAVLERLTANGGPDGPELDLFRLALCHEDMHGEAFVYTRQTLGYAAPQGCMPHTPGCGPLPGDVEVAGGPGTLGADPTEGFAMDNEQWAHEVTLAPFRIARAPVTQAAFLEFVEDGGYARRELWSEQGWKWRDQTRTPHPVYWRREESGTWARRRYDRWVPLEDCLPMHFVNAHEAEAWCRWAGRRLPSEAEWERAAGTARYPWGNQAPSEPCAQLDLCTDEPCEVGTHPDGETPLGLRQMIGNVWEWTATPFGPYPGFTPGHYRDYSQPWFEGHRVLRGGAFATRGRMLSKTWRNFYRPDRNDVLAGFRTCALD